MPAASWVFSSSSSRRCLKEFDLRGAGGVAGGGSGAIFLRLRGGPIRKTALPAPAFEVEGVLDAPSRPPASTGSSPSSSSCMVSLLIRWRLLTDFAREFREVDGGVRSTLCFFDTGLGSSSAGVCLVVRRFRFPREGSPEARETLSDAREIAGESVARPLDVRGGRELLELLAAGLVGVDAVNTRCFFGLLGADITVNPHPSAK